MGVPPEQVCGGDLQAAVPSPAQTSRRHVGVGVGGFITGLVALALTLAGGRASDVSAYPPLVLLIGWGFIGCGLFALRRRPENRIGAMMTAVGFCWFLASAAESDVELIHMLGLFVAGMWGGFAVHGLLAFPSGELENRGERLVVVTSYVDATVLQVLPLLFGGGSEAQCPTCPTMLAGRAANAEVADALLLVQRSVLAAVGVGVCVALHARWRRSAAAQRRALTPILWCGGATTVLLAAAAASASGDPYTMAGPLDWAWLAAFACVPFAFVSALVHSRLRSGGVVSELIERLGEPHSPGKVRDALATALGDPSLTIAYWLPDQKRHVDGSGEPVRLPDAASGRTCTAIWHGGRRLAAIVHDSALCEEPGLVRSAGVAAALSLENERLDAELRARVEELRGSRARLVEAGDTERRRIERDLHDGAQQRLVSLLLNVNLARRKAAGDRLHGPADGHDALWDELEGELVAALAQLRALASGILPPILADHGLPAAIEDLAYRSPLTVEVEEMAVGRLALSVEVAAYFVVSEALTNVAKHAGTLSARLRVARQDGRLLVEISDDGVGGVKLEDGTGLRGLADRVGALDGRLRLDSPAGSGTRIRAEIPCAS
jgi:signal transduction histidine kinase